MQAKRKKYILNNTLVIPKPTIIITEPTRASRRFEDNVTVIRIYNPDPVREAAALRHLLGWVAREMKNERDKMPTV